MSSLEEKNVVFFLNVLLLFLVAIEPFLFNELSISENGALI